MSIVLGERHFPFNVALEITRACNLRCQHCGTAADGRNRSAPLSVDEWKKVIDDLRRLCARHITFSGGEPFLHKHWRELLQYMCAPRDGTIVSIISNGTVVNEDDVIFMKRQGLSHLVVSIDGDAEVHDTVRCSPGAFDKTMNTVALCRKHDLAIGVVTALNRLNFDIRERIRDLVLDAGVDMWQVQIVNAFGRAGAPERQMTLGAEQYDRLIEDVTLWRNQPSGRTNIVSADSLGYCDACTDALFDGAEWYGCSAGLYNVGIEANGDVKGCLSLQDPSFVTDNVRNRSLVDIWFDPKSFAYTRQYDVDAMTGRCGDCDSKERCRAGCLATAYSVTGATTEAPYCYSGGPRSVCS